MKTKNIHVKKLCKLIGLVLLLTFVLVSCDRYGMSLPSPKPVENPVYLTAEAQTYDTRVRNLSIMGIGAENPETDEVYVDNHQTGTSNPSIEIKNDWITLYKGGALPKEIIQITVKENPSNTPRSYEVKLDAKGREGRLLIIQKGRDDD